MEVHREKNVATYIVFPIVDADGDFVSSAADLDSEIDAWSDGSAPDGFADCTNEATEIGSSGIYYLLLSSDEMNHDYIVIQIKTSTSGAKTQMILINTKPFTEIDAIYDKLPTNYIMGSSVQTAKDDEIDDILTDTGTTLQNDITAIKNKTDNLPNDAEDYLDRILGLLGKYLVWEYTWSDDENTTVGIWIYDNSTNFTNHDKSTGLVAEYEAVVTYSGGKPTVKKIEQKQ